MSDWPRMKSGSLGFFWVARIIRLSPWNLAETCNVICVNYPRESCLSLTQIVFRFPSCVATKGKTFPSVMWFVSRGGEEKEKEKKKDDDHIISGPFCNPSRFSWVSVGGRGGRVVLKCDSSKDKWWARIIFGGGQGGRACRQYLLYAGLNVTRIASYIHADIITRLPNDNLKKKKKARRSCPA